MTDTLITPGRATADILGQVYDADGKQTFSNQVAGSYSESFPLFSGPETVSRMTGKVPGGGMQPRGAGNHPRSKVCHGPALNRPQYSREPVRSQINAAMAFENR